MLFISIEFAVFLPVVFALYWFVVNKNLKLQNSLLLLASYLFYGWWDWRFLFLLISISLINYFIGIRIDKDDTGKTRVLWLSFGLLANLGTLCLFKYCNFFIDSFIDLFSLFGYHMSRYTTRIVLPLGISFYTFLSLSYILDIFKKNLKADRDIIEVLLTLSFFPIILAGPIQRPSALLPQIMKKREFKYSEASDGLRQILWGLFKKVAIADNCAKYVAPIFDNYTDYSGSTLVIGILLFAIQIYGDFSGYSDIAIGTARLFGFSIMRNFAFPYYARDIAEFWKRWHISLTTWFRDYLFLPLSIAVSRGIKNGKIWFIKADLFIYIIASIVTWFLTGLWHGANFTFIAWGLIHGFFLILYQWQKQPRKKLFAKIGIKNNNPFILFFETVITLCIVFFTWVFFRSPDIKYAFSFLERLFTNSPLSLPQLIEPKSEMVSAMVLICILIIAEWIQRDKQHALQIEKYPTPIRWGIYFSVFLLIFFFGAFENTQFIYFQF
jgi:alginate O-acetyltransferase complex protein AlgI